MTLCADRFPQAGIGEILQGRRALILSPHPDDESLGCGGFIAASCAAGLAPVVAFLTDGAASHPGSASHPPRQLAGLRRAEARAALRILGVPAEHIMFMDFADAAMPDSGADFEAAAAMLVRIARALDCGLVLGPWVGDPHCDHVAGAKLGARVAALSGLANYNYVVWGWLHPGETTADCGVRLDVAAWQSRKQAAIRAHRSQHGEIVQDSPNGFAIPPALMAAAAARHEVFLRAAP
jgi:LmbE family N-acetylglucosaminyl deacetylase